MREEKPEEIVGTLDAKGNVWVTIDGRHHGLHRSLFSGGKVYFRVPVKPALRDYLGEDEPLAPSVRTKTYLVTVAGEAEPFKPLMAPPISPRQQLINRYLCMLWAHKETDSVQEFDARFARLIDSLPPEVSMAVEAHFPTYVYRPSAKETFGGLVGKAGKASDFHGRVY